MVLINSNNPQDGLGHLTEKDTVNLAQDCINNLTETGIELLIKNLTTEQRDTIFNICVDLQEG